MSPDASCWKDWGGINTDCWAGTHGHHRPGSPRLARCALMTQEKVFHTLDGKPVHIRGTEERRKAKGKSSGKGEDRNQCTCYISKHLGDIWGTNTNKYWKIYIIKSTLSLWLDTTKPTFSGFPFYGKDPISFHVSTPYFDFKLKAAKHDVTFTNKAQLCVDILTLKYLTFTPTYSSLNRLTYQPASCSSYTTYLNSHSLSEH